MMMISYSITFVIFVIISGNHASKIRSNFRQDAKPFYRDHHLHEDYNNILVPEVLFRLNKKIMITYFYRNLDSIHQKLRNLA